MVEKDYKHTIVVFGRYFLNPSIAKIAEIAGVSTATVSRVINNPEKVTEKTRRRVMQVINEFGYVPNEFARGLRSQKKNMVGMIIPSNKAYFLYFPSFSYFLKGVTETLASEGYYTIISMEESGVDPRTSYKNLISKNLIDGFILLELRENDPRIEYLIDHSINFVTIGRTKKNDSYTYVDLDNSQGAYLATKHLLSLNRSKILFISGEKKDCCCIHRQEGYLRALEESGISIDNELIVNSDSSEDMSFNIVARALNQADFDSIFAVSDMAAIGALKALEFFDKKMPVIGFDDIPISRYFKPPLTTVRQPMQEMGKLSADLLIRKLNGEKPKSELVDAELIKRESTLRFL